MPGVRACIPCKYPDSDDYIRRRVAEGANLTTIRAELDTPFRKKMYGYQKGPTTAMLREHQAKHRGLSPVRDAMPTFAGTSSAVAPVAPAGDVATAIQEEALAALARGELRVTAANALKAQEILDRRAERAADRQLTLVLARLATMGRPPEDIIEGEVVDLGTADD